MEKNILGFRRKRSPLIAPLQLHRMRCVAASPTGGNRLFEEIFCVPGTTFMKGCNRCMCRETGTSAYCTAKDCLMQLSSLCLPAGSVKIVDCNVCICGFSRTWACSSFDCRPRLHYVDCETSAAQFDDFETSIENCRPGTTFRRNCNLCYCSEDGTSAVCSTQPCTRIKDDDWETESTQITRVSNQECRPGTSFMSGCNQCYCSEDGTSAVCRSRPCNSVKGTLLPLKPICGDEGGCKNNTQIHPRGEKVGTGGRVGGKGGGSGGQRRKGLALQLVIDQLPCLPGDIVYEDNCFSCYCLVDGASILCLNLDCELEDMGSAPLQTYAINRPKVADVPLVTKQVKCSSSAKVFSEGCNSCICVDADSGPVCTNWPCTDSGRTHSDPKRMKRSSQHCEPYTAYKKSCNICFCNMNGTNAVCTNLACHTGAQGDDPAASSRWGGALATTDDIHEELQRARLQQEGDRRNLHEQKVPRSDYSSISAG
ncbi:uncharacterized protein LOC124545503 [Schistocerca americana]|uniref:uncharacterized protein LOC124545503 n=1 Tax=Schistocerca americana TaxID=7009 RepID=UPI001F4F44DE|nr:uncharacterized protein LOC124545503 [Schistocerca americana]